MCGFCPQLADEVKKTRKENAALKKKTEETDYLMVKYVSQNAELTKELTTALQQKTKLEALCRALQKRTETDSKSESVSSSSSSSTSSSDAPAASDSKA